MLFTPIFGYISDYMAGYSPAIDLTFVMALNKERQNADTVSSIADQIGKLAQ